MTDARTDRWRKLAEAACAERDPEKLIQIVEELNRALEQATDNSEGGRPRQDRNSDELGKQYSSQETSFAYCL